VSQLWIFTIQNVEMSKPKENQLDSETEGTLIKDVNKCNWFSLLVEFWSNVTLEFWDIKKPLVEPVIRHTFVLIDNDIKEHGREIDG